MSWEHIKEIWHSLPPNSNQICNFELPHMNGPSWNFLSAATTTTCKLRAAQAFVLGGGGFF
jgi:hypothetical protein